MPGSRSAVVEAGSLGRGVTIAEFAVVRSGAVLGDDVIVHPHAVIEADVVIGEGTEVMPGAYRPSPEKIGAIMREPSFERRLSIGPGPDRPERGRLLRHRDRRGHSDR